MDTITKVTLTYPAQLNEIVLAALLELDLQELESHPTGVSCFPSSLSSETIRDTVLEHVSRSGFEGTVEVSTTELSDQGWEEKWKEFWEPIEIGNSLIIVPTWLTNVDTKQRTPVYLDTTSAFGTGSHETTQLALEAVELVVSKQKPQSLLDVGCGSGVLSITASKLGVQSVTGLDIDQVAIETAKRNAEVNNISNVTFAMTPVSDIKGPFPVIVSNMISSRLDGVWNSLQALRSESGVLILSGILIDEVEDFIEKHGLQDATITTRGKWSALVSE